MVYYKVKPEYDNKILYYNGKYKGILIGDELYTEKELSKQKILFCHGICYEMFERVEIPKSKVYWFFGARLQVAE